MSRKGPVVQAVKILLQACAEHYLETRQAQVEQTFTTECASAKTEIPGELLVLAVCQACKLSAQWLPTGLPAPGAGPRRPRGPQATRSLSCHPSMQQISWAPGNRNPSRAFRANALQQARSCFSPLSLSLFLFSCLAFANPQAAVSLSKEALMGGGPGKISPTDECNLDRKYVFYQRPHVANSN